ncbi:hypothetical protein ALC56_01526 [Trachymyrmex septentrionalis]|uniref:Uncharacterized protein n=1 Tax=Trachymyrmex septentrionalis TaxID=34720 RepID=A0A195FU53_9HYME|nr:hypothetical protein ALC56_01526 [Trachymyrmex septentrionalis]
MKNRSPLTNKTFLKRDDTYRTTYDGLYGELTEASGTVSSREEEDTGANKSKTEHETWFCRGVCRDRFRRDRLLTNFFQCMNRWLNRSDYASERGTSLVGRVRTRRTPNVRFTYKRRANAPTDDGHVTPPHSPSSVSTYYEDTTFCDAMQLSPEPPPLPRCQPHHRHPAGTDVRTPFCLGASLCLLLPPSAPIRLSIRSFIRKNTHLDRASVNAAPNRRDPEVLDKPKGLRYPARAVTRDTSR